MLALVSFLCLITCNHLNYVYNGSTSGLFPCFCEAALAPSFCEKMSRKLMTIVKNESRTF